MTYFLLSMLAFYAVIVCWPRARRFYWCLLFHWDVEMRKEAIQPQRWVLWCATCQRRATKP